MDVVMRDSDAFAWYMERDPTLQSTIVGVAWLERSADWDLLLTRIDRATRVIPMFRQRVIDPPGRFAAPRWTVDDTFDLGRHVHRVDSPAPHTPATVIAIARGATMTVFDRTRPLWQFTLVEGLEGGRAALVMKVHHALTDGIGGMQLLLDLFDVEPVPPPLEPLPDDAEPEPGNATVTGERLWNEPARALRSVGRVARSAARNSWAAALHPVAGAGEVMELASSIARTIRPVNETLSPIMKERSAARSLDVLEVRVSDLKRAAAAADGSINDGFMAAVTGGLRRYHELHAAPVEELRVTLPISIRKPGDPPGGNRITLIRFAVPVADADPASRIRAMDRLCRAARDERSLDFTGAIAAMLNLLPRGYVGNMLKHVDFLASDIPGYAFPIYLVGVPVERFCTFAPTVGTAVNLALLSYNGTCAVGISMDPAAVPDTDVLAECFRQGFEEVLTLGGEHDPVRLPLRDAAAAPA